MKFNFWGYDTKTMIALGLDANDLAFIQWFRDFKDSGKMESIETVNGTAYYVSYTKVIEDIPFLFKSSTGVEDEIELKKIEATNKKKVVNMLKGNLSKAFTRHEKKEQCKTKIYLTLNANVFTALVNNGQGFDITEIKEEKKVVKLETRMANKKAPSTAGTVKDASPTNDETNSSQNKSINDTSIPQETEDVNDLDNLNINTIALLDSGIITEKCNLIEIDKVVKTWDGLVLHDAITKTLISAKKPNFNYVKKVYDSLLEDGLENAKDNALKSLLTPNM
ncbi:hypothetical protein [Romboutsia ilealis]|uniref:hypothetical protein n=1 Tax=Romboutsia ilealis TaxID=1115758 RepID=UPI0026F3BC25|nr:hypothetical protein [Romboutsia ilealis]